MRGADPRPAPTGREGTRVSTRDSSYSDSLKMNTSRSTTTITTDYSTLGRLRKNINELDTLIDSLEESQQHGTAGQQTVEVRKTTAPIKATYEKAPPPVAAPVRPASTTSPKKKATKAEEVKPDPMETAVSLALASAKQTTTTTTKRTVESHSSETGQRKVPREEGSKWMLCGAPVWPLLPSSSHFFLLSSKERVFSHAKEVIACGVSIFPP